MKSNRFVLAAATIVAGVSFSAAAPAADLAGGTFQTKINITAECVMSGTKTDLDFGSSSSMASSAASASNGGFSVLCTNQTPYAIGLQSTAAESSSTGNGIMKATGITQTIGYQLYQDGGTTVWGNVNSGSLNTKSATGSGIAQAYTVYGKTLTSLNVPAGSYTDTVAITVYY